LGGTNNLGTDRSSGRDTQTFEEGRKILEVVEGVLGRIYGRYTFLRLEEYPKFS